MVLTNAEKQAKWRKKAHLKPMRQVLGYTERELWCTDAQWLELRTVIDSFLFEDNGNAEFGKERPFVREAMLGLKK